MVITLTYHDPKSGELVTKPLNQAWEALLDASMTAQQRRHEAKKIRKEYLDTLYEMERQEMLEMY